MDGPGRSGDAEPLPLVRVHRRKLIRTATVVCGWMGFLFGCVVIPLLVNPLAPHTTAIFAAGALASLLCAIGYLMARAGRESMAVGFVIAAALFGPLVATPSSSLILVYTLAAVGMASLVFSAWRTTIVGLLAAATPFAAMLYVEDLELLVASVMASGIFTVSAVLVIIRLWNSYLDRSIAARGRRYARMIESLPDGVLVLDSGGNILACNPAFAEMVGADAASIVGKASATFGLDAGQISDGAQAQALASHLLECADGTQIPVESHPRIDPDAEGGPMVVVVVRSLVERERAEQEAKELRGQLRSSRRLESLGQLAGGVAHDLNNLLTVIIAGCDLLDEEPTSGGMNDIRAASLRAGDLVSQLLTFARRQPRTPTVIDLSAVLRGLEGILSKLIREDIDLELNARDEAWVLADQTQMEQVIVNLVANAKDALPRGGKIAVSTRLVSTADGRGSEVVLVVEDDGLGMSAEDQERVFEPFFSTKEASGTGLGLATVYGIVTQSQGTVDVKTSLGGGSSFTVRLPAQSALDSTTQSSQRVGPELIRGGTVLVVDDEPAVLAAVCRSLEAGGHRVLSATSGQMALDHLAELSGEIDLLLTDVVMPGLRGPELAERLRQSFPQLRVLFMSGYTEDEAIPEEQIIFKPFAPAEIRSRVASELRQVAPVPAANQTA